MYSEAIELRQEIIKLKSKNQYLISLSEGLITLTRARIRGIPIVLLIGNIVVVGLTLISDSLLIASLNLTLCLKITEHKIQRTKIKAQILLWSFLCRIRLEIFQIYRKIHHNP